MKLVIATTNAGKLRELESALAGDGIDVLSLADFPAIPDIVEDGATFLENAFIKARTVAKTTGIQALADDSGLMVDALDGEPGVRSARFAPTTEERNAKLLAMLKDVPDNERTARFVCAMAFVRPDGFEWSTEGRVEGVIAKDIAGDGGFGYDPLFFYPPMGVTFAELSKEAKNGISHRGTALAKFLDAVKSDGILH